MAKLKVCALAGAMVLASSVAFAADVPMEPVPVAPLPVAFGGWYLRGDIGFSNQSVDGLQNVLYDGTSNLNHTEKNFDGAPFGGLGVGYRFNKWFRVDATGEYRSRATFHGMDTFQFTDGVDTFNGADTYTGSKSEWTGLFNAYVDLGNWAGFSPFVGAGIGFSHNTISDFTDSGINVNNTTGLTATSLAYGNSDSTWNFAWALQAGLAYEVTPGFTVDLAYRYLDLGDGQSGDLVTYTGTNNVNNPMKFNDITSQDVKLGLRWAIGGPAAGYPGSN